MKIAVIGTGYVGLVSGTCFAEFGFDVVCVDKNQAKIDLLNKGQVPIFEPGLDRLIASNMENNRLSFSTELQKAVKRADVVFIAVGTPMSETGEADLTYVFQAAEEIAKAIEGYTVIVTKSTVPVDTGFKIAERVRIINPQAEFDMVSNPEFLREGAAIEDFMRPNRVVIGSQSERATEVMRKLYRPLYLLETPIVVTSLETAELIKYASNAFLATKVAFINEIADLCEKCGADVQAVATGMGLDQRIGKKFLHAGPGYGGSCFPKDTLALVRTAETYGVPTQIVESVVESNTTRKKKMAQKIMEGIPGGVKGKTIGVLGVTFKPNTDDMRDAPSLDIIPTLQKAGAQIQAFDPQGQKEAEKLFTEVTWKANSYEAVKDVDAAVILTEWNEFRALDLNRLRKVMGAPLVIDLRNIYSPEEMLKHQIDYISVGRADALATANSNVHVTCGAVGA